MPEGEKKAGNKKMPQDMAAENMQRPDDRPMHKEELVGGAEDGENGGPPKPHKRRRRRKKPSGTEVRDEV